MRVAPRARGARQRRPGGSRGGGPPPGSFELAHEASPRLIKLARRRRPRDDERVAAALPHLLLAPQAFAAAGTAAAAHEASSRLINLARRRRPRETTNVWLRLSRPSSGAAGFRPPGLLRLTRSSRPAAAGWTCMPVSGTLGSRQRELSPIGGGYAATGACRLAVAPPALHASALAHLPTAAALARSSQARRASTPPCQGFTAKVALAPTLSPEGFPAPGVPRGPSSPSPPVPRRPARSPPHTEHTPQPVRTSTRT